MRCTQGRAYADRLRLCVEAALLLYFSSSPMHPHWCARKTLLSLPSTTRVKAEARFSWCALLLSFAKGNIFNTPRTHVAEHAACCHKVPTVHLFVELDYCFFWRSICIRVIVRKTLAPLACEWTPQTCSWCSLHISESVLLKYVNPGSYKFNSCPASDHILKSVGF